MASKLIAEVGTLIVNGIFIGGVALVTMFLRTVSM
jgi:hypothetical protein